MERHLPDSWQEETLGEVVTQFVGGGTPSKDILEYYSGDIPFMTVKDMNVTRPSDTIDHITPQAIADSSAKLVPADTLIIATRMGLGKVVRPTVPVAINQDLKAVIPTSSIDKSFLEYWFYSQSHHLESSGTGTTVKGLRLEFLRQLAIPVAPLNEQKRIVDKIEQLFSNLDEGESLLKKVKQQLNIYRQSVLKAAVTGELTKDWRETNKHRLEPGEVLLKRILKTRREQWNGRGQYKEPVAPDTSKLPELPDGWVWLTLDTVTAEIITGPFGSSLHKSDYIPNGTPVINPINIKNGQIFPDRTVAVSDETLDKMERFKVRAGDVIFGRRGEMGRCAPVTHIEDGWLCGTGSLILRPTKVINVEYLVDVLTGLEVRAYLEAHCVGTTMKNLNQQVLLSITLAVPSVTEQSESVDRVNAIFSQIDVLEQWCASELTRSATLRQSILKDAFSGKLVPQDPDDEPACELLKRIQAERSGVQKATKQKSSPITSTRRGRPRKNS